MGSPRSLCIKWVNEQNPSLSLTYLGYIIVLLALLPVIAYKYTPHTKVRDDRWMFF